MPDSLTLAGFAVDALRLANLTLIGMRGDTFISLFFLNQICLAEFVSKISKLLEVKIEIN